MKKLTEKNFDYLASHMQAITNKNVDIGVMFKTGNTEKVLTVVDILTTYNLSGEVFKTEYLCEHEFMGQKIKSRHGKTEILRCLLSYDDAIKLLQ